MFKITCEPLGLSDVKSWLDYQKDEAIPKAIVKGLNNTAYKARLAVIEEMKRVFDRPTPYTLRSIYVEKATPTQYWSRVYIYDEWAGKGTSPIKFLKPEVEGGERQVKPFEKLLRDVGAIKPGQFLLPWKAALNQYGNVNPGVIQKVLSAFDAQRDGAQNSKAKKEIKIGKNKRVVRRYFTTDRHNQIIIWERTQTRLVPLFTTTEKTPRYKKRLHFNEIVEEVADKVLWIEFMNAMESK